MIYLFFQTWIWILGAGLLGLFIGWLIWGRRNERDALDLSRVKRQLEECRERSTELEQRAGIAPAFVVSAEQGAADSAFAGEGASVDNAESSSDTGAGESGQGNAAELAEAEIQDDWKPVALGEPENGVADDLKRIKGVGPVIEKTLNELGIFHFRQIGNFTEDNIRWVDHYIAFPGRIKRENWVTQSRQLAAGGTTEFSDRYDQK